MNHYNHIPGILETGIELVSPHLRWLVKNAILEHCPSTAINMIAYNEDIPVNVFGFADGPTRSIAINLKHHFDKMSDDVEKQKDIHSSLNMLILHEILDTVIHEAHHLRVCEEKKSFKAADLNEEGAIAAATEKSWKVAKFWDCNVKVFGPFLDAKIKDFMTAVEEDTKEKPNMWQDLQVYMYKNNLGYYNPDKETELSIAQTFEALSKDPLIWTKDAIQFMDTVIQTDVKTQPEVVNEVVAKQESIPTQSAMDAARALLQQNLVNTQVSTPWQEDEAPYEHDDAEGHPWLDTPAAAPVAQTPVPMQAHTVEKIIETVLRTLFWNVTSKCEFTTEGGYNNPYAVLEPVSIAHIPGALQLFTHMDCYNETGKYMHSVPTTEGIRGIVTKANMPKYELYMYLNGVHHKRTFMAYDNNAIDSRTQDYKPWAKVVRSGTKLMYILNKTTDEAGLEVTKVTAKITLEKGLPLGQEKFEFLKWKSKQE